MLTPQNDNTTHKFHKAKYTSKTGSGSKWRSSAIKVYKDLCTHIKAVRKADKKNKWQKYSFALEEVRREHKIQQDGPPKKKQKRGKTKQDDNEGNITDVEIEFDFSSDEEEEEED